MNHDDVKYYLVWDAEKEGECYVAVLTSFGMGAWGNLRLQGEETRTALLNVISVLPNCSLSKKLKPKSEVIRDLCRQGGERCSA